MICPSATKESKVCPKGLYHIPDSKIQYKVLTSFDDLQPLHSTHSLFQRAVFNKIMETHPSRDIVPFYIELFEEGKYLGMIQCQTYKVRGDKAFRVENTNQGFSAAIKKWSLKQFELRTLILGNVLLSGNFGLIFRDEKKVFELIKLSVPYFQKQIEEKLGYKFNLILCKDYPLDRFEMSKTLIKDGFHGFLAEPVMALENKWESFDDYLAAMSSKYRKNVKRAQKKGAAIVRKEFNYERILAHNDRIYRLYSNICESVDFNLVHLDRFYFAELKKQYGDDFKLVGYFLDDELISFTTTIKDGDETHAHFLGIDDSYNPEYMLYLNMLLDITRIGIEENESKKIDFARTAAEIKSSIGAEPEDMYIYIKHLNPLFNKLMPRFMKFIENSEEIKYRHPFKKG